MGKQLKSSILMRNPVAVKLVVNGRYPRRRPDHDDAACRGVLQTLAAASAKDLEFRFINDNLIILDKPCPL
jgi:hypothetical protein